MVFLILVVSAFFAACGIKAKKEVTPEEKLQHMNIEVAIGPFLQAVSEKNEEVCNLFLETGFNLSSSNEDGQTVLMAAARVDYGDMAKRLLEKDPEILNLQDKNGWNALAYAVINGQMSMLSVLENGDWKAVDKDGNTMLHLAIANNQTALLQGLWDHGIDVNKKNNQGDAPLILAVRRQDVTMAQQLIEHGADVETVDGDGRSAVKIAKSLGNTAMVSMLKDHGAYVPWDKVYITYTQSAPNARVQVSQSSVTLHVGQPLVIQMSSDSLRGPTRWFSDGFRRLFDSESIDPTGNKSSTGLIIIPKHVGSAMLKIVPDYSGFEQEGYIQITVVE